MFSFVENGWLVCFQCTLLGSTILRGSLFKGKPCKLCLNDRFRRSNDSATFQRPGSTSAVRPKAPVELWVPKGSRANSKHPLPPSIPFSSFLKGKQKRTPKSVCGRSTLKTTPPLCFSLQGPEASAPAVRSPQTSSPPPGGRRVPWPGRTSRSERGQLTPALASWVWRPVAR